MNGSVTKTYNIAGVTITEQSTPLSDSSQHAVNPTLAVAQNGSFGSRSNNTVGTLTLSANHGITTGQRIDLFWSTGVRYGITAGTVSGTSVPISGGDGDNLPANGTTIKAGIVSNLSFPLVGDNLTLLALRSTAEAQFTFNNGTADVASFHFSAGIAYDWYTGQGRTNPLAGLNDITRLYVSQNGVSSAATAQAATLSH